MPEQGIAGMAHVIAGDHFDVEDSADAHYAKKRAFNAQRIVDFTVGHYSLGGGVVGLLPRPPLSGMRWQCGGSEGNSGLRYHYTGAA